LTSITLLFFEGGRSQEDEDGDALVSKKKRKW
jgi:hypothetical protein